MIDINKVQFSSAYPIDKAVAPEQTVIVVNSGNTAPNGSQTANIFSSTVANPYGKKCFVRYKWSIDNSNFNSPLAHIDYTFNYTVPGPFTSVLNGLKAAVSIGVSDTTVTFLTANGFHGNVTVDGSGNESYTPNSLTFFIQFILYEIS